MVCKNNQVPNDHLRKDWYKRVKFYFDDPFRAQRRHKARIIKAHKMAPKPAETLRPAVHCPTVRYNTKLRLGRGFTREELIKAGFEPSRARFLGIAVDLRRSHSSQINIERLQEYKKRLILVKDGKKVENKPTYEQISAPELFALPKAKAEIKYRVIKAEEKKKDLFAEKQKKYKEIRAAKKAKKEAAKKK